MTSPQLAATQTLDLHLAQTLEEELLVLVMSRNYMQQPEASDDESKNRTVEYSTTTQREREREKSKRDRYIPESPSPLRIFVVELEIKFAKSRSYKSFLMQINCKSLKVVDLRSFTDVCSRSTLGLPKLKKRELLSLLLNQLRPITPQPKKTQEKRSTCVCSSLVGRRGGRWLLLLLTMIQNTSTSVMTHMN